MDFNEDDLIDAAVAAVLEDADGDYDNDEDYFADGLHGNLRERVFVDMLGWRMLDGIAFREHFRMRRPTFEVLLLTIGRHLLDGGKLYRFSTPFDQSLLLTVWVLCNGDTFRSTAAQFGVSKSTVFHHYAYMIQALRELAPRFIRWPSAVERQCIGHNFERRNGYPGVVGCIDGTFIEITAPLEQPQNYVNRHHQYSILVQAVCDDNLLYRDVYVGEPGSIGDARMYDRSPLSDVFLRRPDVIAEDEHLLGDGAYPLGRHVRFTNYECNK